MAELVYILCAATSTACTVLLLRGYRLYRTRLLFWSALSFALLAIHNLLLYVDMITLKDGPDLLLLRTSVGATAGVLLLFGLIRETVGPKENR